MSCLPACCVSAAVCVSGRQSRCQAAGPCCHPPVFHHFLCTSGAWWVGRAAASRSHSLSHHHFHPPREIHNRPDSPRFSPDGTLAFSVGRMDPVGNDTDKWIIIRPSGKMSFFSTQVANISDAREYGYSGGRWPHNAMAVMRQQPGNQQ